MVDTYRKAVNVTVCSGERDMSKENATMPNLPQRPVAKEKLWNHGTDSTVM